MVLETDPIVFLEWFPTAFLYWLFSVAGILLGGLIIAFIATAAIHGPLVAGDRVFGTLRSAAGDLAHTSPRRVWALARLAFQESLRRRALAGVVVFLLILMFALWFLGDRTRDPAALYLSFVLTATTYLILLMQLFLSSLSLPADMKNKTIFTIVTKPVRPSEIVLGRIVGFSMIGTLLLAVMGTASYFFVVRGFDHTHELTAEDLATEISATGDRQVLRGVTSNERGHRHSITLADEGGATDTAQGHWHEVTVTERQGQTVYDVGPALGQFQARVPVYGKLQFKNRTGEDVAQGINVGNEWTYRSYVEGGTLAAAIWRFQGITPERFPGEGLRLQLNIRVFRTHKGDVEKAIVGSIVLRNPRTGVQSSPRNFPAREFAIDERFIPRELEDSSGRPIDLFADLASDGELEVVLSCLERGQYFGMAQPDVFLLAGQQRFELNFLKGYVTIWLQMVLVTAFGVMWSTFLNGAVAMLATLTTLIGGFFVDFMRSLAAGELLGGGTFESFVRMAQQRNIMTELDPGLATSVVTGLDMALQVPMMLVVRLLPNFRRLSDVNYVAQGFDIPIDLLASQFCMLLGYLIPVFIAGFLFFKMREVAK